jgi:hypothetical protein
VAVPRLVRLDRASAGRYFRPERKLLILFPAGDLYPYQRGPDAFELAVSALKGRQIRINFYPGNATAPVESLPARP